MIGEYREVPIARVRQGRFYAWLPRKVNYYAPNLAGSKSKVWVWREWVRWRRVNDEKTEYWIDPEYWEDQ